MDNQSIKVKISNLGEPKEIKRILSIFQFKTIDTDSECEFIHHPEYGYTWVKFSQNNTTVPENTERGYVQYWSNLSEAMAHWNQTEYGISITDQLSEDTTEFMKEFVG